MQTRVRFGRDLPAVRPVWRDERGFTLLEVMIAIVLLTVGLLAAADSFPRLTAAALYGKDQTRGTNLAQQQIEIYRTVTPSALGSLAGNYGTVASALFDQNGNAVTQTGSTYFTRDVQIQYWAWVTSTSAFAPPINPYTTPTAAYVYHIAVATHWLVRGQTTFTTGTTAGCVTGGTAATVGLGCVTVGTFVAP